MKARITAIVACLALLSGPAPAKPPKAHAPSARAEQKPAPKGLHQSAPKGAEKKPEAKQAADAVTNRYAAMPADQRLAIQTDLAWTGFYDGPAGTDFDDQRLIDAVKRFQAATKEADTGILTDEERARLAIAAEPHRQAAGWRVIDDPATGARFGIPEKLVSPLDPSRTGSRWSSGHGQIRIDTFAMSDASLPALFESDKRTPKGRWVESNALTSNSFVMSGTQGLKYFVARAESSGRQVRGITILYDQATAGIVAPVALAVANSFQGFPDPAAALPPDEERTVEYGTAVAVDDRGDLISTRQVAADCKIITIPGFGHPVLLAKDDASGLALIRLYGAENLSPITPTGESQGSDLTIVGIAGPAAQRGGGAITKVAAQRDGRNLTPAPQSGFSGAVAIDAQGRFAGIVALTSSSDASGSVTRRASLVPAAVVGAFLKAYGIPPAPARAAIEPSIVRVICVRQ